MSTPDIPHLRLAHQQLAAPRFGSPGELVAWLGAVQAQDFPGAKWSLGARLPGSTDADIERALAERQIVRTWPQRGTLHFVAPADLRWMLALLTPRIVAGAARRFRELELDDAVFARSYDVLTSVLTGGRQLPRPDVMAAFEAAGIRTEAQRGYHILWRAAQAGLICHGPMAGKQPTFVLLDEWVPPGRELAGDEALAELAARYFRSHGPATLADFVWWAGLPVGEARRGLALVAEELATFDVDGQTYWQAADAPSVAPDMSATYLLSTFDEYLLGYTDRSAVLHPDNAHEIFPGGGMLRPTIVRGGQVVGSWQRQVKRAAVVVTARPFAPLDPGDAPALAAAAERYAAFLGLALALGVEDR